MSRIPLVTPFINEFVVADVATVSANTTGTLPSSDQRGAYLTYYSLFDSSDSPANRGYSVAAHVVAIGNVPDTQATSTPFRLFSGTMRGVPGAASVLVWEGRFPIWSDSETFTNYRMRVDVENHTGTDVRLFGFGLIEVMKECQCPKDHKGDDHDED